MSSKIGRNDPCSCGSGKKYKKCCLNNVQKSGVADIGLKRLKCTGLEMVYKLTDHYKKILGDGYEDMLEECWDDFHCENFSGSETDYETVLCHAVLPWMAYNFLPCDDQVGGGRGTFVQDYIKRFAGRLSSYDRSYLEVESGVEYSYYEVVGVVSGHSLRIKDLLRGGDDINIFEKMGSQNMSVGSVLMARVVTFKGISVFSGLYPFIMPASFISYCIDFRKEHSSDFWTDERLHECSDEIREYYINSINSAKGSPLPEILNSDGDKLLPTSIKYTLNCPVLDAFDALCSLGLRDDFSREDLLDDAVFNDSGEMVEVRFPCFAVGSVGVFSGTIIGEIMIDESQISLECNSVKRADEYKVKIEGLLGSKASYVRTTHTPIDIKSNNSGVGDGGCLVSGGDAMPPEVQAQLRAMSSSYWESWLTTCVPALDSQKPVDACKSVSGREKLESLFSDFHQKNLALEAKGDLFNIVDIAYLRRELNMS